MNSSLRLISETAASSLKQVKLAAVFLSEGLYSQTIISSLAPFSGRFNMLIQMSELESSK
jgi:hypothetical protein